VRKILDITKDLDAYIAHYNTKRLHQGRGMGVRTPAEAFVRCLPKPKKPKEEKLTEAD